MAKVKTNEHLFSKWRKTKSIWLQTNIRVRIVFFFFMKTLSIEIISMKTKLIIVWETVGKHIELNWIWSISFLTLFCYSIRSKRKISSNSIDSHEARRDKNTTWWYQLISSRSSCCCCCIRYRTYLVKTLQSSKWDANTRWRIFFLVQQHRKSFSLHRRHGHLIGGVSNEEFR